MNMPRLFVASTGQDAGKTTFCCAYINYLTSSYSRVAYIKPVGQKSIKQDHTEVDKDSYLFNEYFNLKESPTCSSPVIFHPKFTKEYLDGRIDIEAEKERIQSAYNELTLSHDAILAEGSGHVGVGSICDINNASVAKMLGMDVLLIGGGGIGKAFDELMLNISLCYSYGVNVMGVILNRVLPEKLKEVSLYMEKALSRLHIPLLGCIPKDPLLFKPTIGDFQQLFKTELIAGKEHALRHFDEFTLAATTTDSHCRKIKEKQLTIVPHTRLDILDCTLEADLEYRTKGKELKCGLIITGKKPLPKEMVDRLCKARIPTLYSGLMSYETMQLVSSFVAKIRLEDTVKIERAISLVQESVDLERIHFLSLRR